jgi:hypothetical protein
VHRKIAVFRIAKERIFTDVAAEAVLIHDHPHPVAAHIAVNVDAGEKEVSSSGECGPLRAECDDRIPHTAARVRITTESARFRPHVSPERAPGYVDIRHLPGADRPGVGGGVAGKGAAFESSGDKAVEADSAARLSG